MMYKSQFHKIDPYDWFCGRDTCHLQINAAWDFLRIYYTFLSHFCETFYPFGVLVDVWNQFYLDSRKCHAVELSQV